MSFFTLALIWLVGWVLFTISVTHAKPEKPGKQVEAIVVVTGGTGRIHHALDLLAEGNADKLFISGVNEDVQHTDIIAGWNEFRAEASLPVLSEPCCIELGYTAKDTTGNALEIKKWVEENGITSIRLVTSNYHMPRAYMEVRNHLPPDTAIYRHPFHYAKDGIFEKKFLFLVF